MNGRRAQKLLFAQRCVCESPPGAAKRLILWVIVVLWCCIFLIKESHDGKNKISEKAPAQLKKQGSRCFLFVLITQAVIIAAFVVLICVKASSPKQINTSLSDWKSDYIKFSEGVWYADADSVNVDETVRLIYGPYVSLKKGFYSVTVNYDCESEQLASATAGDGMSAFITTGDARLTEHLHSTEFLVHVRENVEKFEVIVKYNGYGYIKIRNISIRENYAGYGRLLAYFLALFVLLDVAYIFLDKIKKNRTTIFMLIGITLLALSPFFQQASATVTISTFIQ